MLPIFPVRRAPNMPLPGLPRSRPAFDLELLEPRDTPVVFSNTAAIAIPDTGAANPNPSQITVAGMGDQLTSISVTLTGVTHTTPDDLDILLVAPGGQSSILMSDCGGTNAVTGTNYTFLQGGFGVGSMPDSSAIPSGNYRATNFDTTTDNFGAGAPAGPYTVTLGTFANINPNGVWSLYVIDDTGTVPPATPSTGSIAGGWSINISAPPRMTGLSLASPNPTSAATVDYTATFNVPVVNVDVSDFQVLTTSGPLTGASVVSVSGSGATYTVTVNTGTGDGTLRLNLVDDDSIAGQNAPLTTTPLGGNGNNNGDFTGDVYTVDKPPVVASITRAAANPTNAVTVTFTVTFTELVSGVDASDFAVAMGGGVTGASVTGVTGTGNTRTVTVNTGSGDGTLGLNLIDNDSINNGGVVLGGPGAGNGNFTTGQAYTVDKTGPTVVSINRAAANPTNAATTTFTVTFSESVTGVNLADFAVAMGGGVTGASVTGVTGSGNTRTVTVNTGSGSGTLGLNLVDDDTVADVLGNKLGGTGTGNGNFTTGQAYTVDKAGPVVTSITRLGGAPNPANATTVDFTVTFDEAAAAGVDASDFAVVMGGGVTGASVTGVTGSGNTRTVTVNTGSGSGTLGLNLNASGTGIEDALGNLASTGFTAGQTYTIDKAGPVVTSITRASTNPTKATTVDFTVTFDETAASGVDASDFAVAMGGSVTGASVTGVTGSGNTRTVTVNIGSGEGTLGLNLNASGTGIADALGNLASTGFTTGETYTIDRTAPAIVSITRASANPTSTATVDFTVTFDEAVTGVDVADFAVVMGGGVTGASVTGVTGSGNTRTVTVNTGSGDGTLGLNLIAGVTGIADIATNLLPNAGLTGAVYAVDKTVPQVVSAVRADPDPTSAPSVAFTVTFSEDVFNWTTADFAITAGGVAGASVISVAGVPGSPALLRVLVGTGTGSGTLRLDVNAGVHLTDIGGNLLTAAFTTGEEYTVTKVAPTVTGVLRASANPTTAATVTYTVYFSAPVTGVDATDFQLTVTGGVTGASVASVTGSGATRTVTVNTGSGDGTLRLDVKASGTGIQDAASNEPLAGGFTTGQVYAVTDPVPPTVTGVVRASANPTTPGAVAYTVYFSAPVTGVDVADFALTTAGISGASVVSVTPLGVGNSHLVTVNTGAGAGTLRLDVRGTGTGIQDAANHEPLAGGFTAGDQYTIQLPPPPPPPKLLPTFVATTPGAAGGTAVTVFDTATDKPTHTFVPFRGFAGAVHSAEGDFNGDGVTDIVVAAGAGGGPHVKVISGANGAELASFFAYNTAFQGGVNIAVGDVNGDGTPDIITGAGAGASPHVKVFDGRTLAELRSFFAYSSAFQGGVNVAAGDVNGDDYADIVTVAGPGGNGHVKAFSGANGAELASFLAFPGFFGGVSVAAGDVNGDGFADIITGAGAGGTPHVKVFSGKDTSLLQSFLAFPLGFAGGVSVGMTDADADDKADIVAGAGPGGTPHVKVFDGETLEVLFSDFAGTPALNGGVLVG